MYMCIHRDGRVVLYVTARPCLLASITLYLHICFLRDRCKSTATQLSGLMLTGCIFQLAGVCGFVAYLVLAISDHQGLVIKGRGYYLACVWCFMTWKWAFLQFYFARRYKRCFEKETGISSDVPYVKI
ncbi:hypothetical protein LSAT2_032607 [Lamellibrachia satsuma]|nr:hypothetical protein LSAT2_032607 [Lamellibrachia satsuma]